MRMHSCGDRSGVALFTVLGIVFAVCLVLGTVIAASSQRIFTARKLADRSRAMVIAEAGVAQAYQMLSTNFALRNVPEAFPPTAFGAGSYDVAVTPVGADIALINSTGVCGSAQESVVLNIKSFPRGGGGSRRSPMPNWPGYDYGFAILAGGSMTWVGNLNEGMETGWVHANNTISGNGEQSITGNVSSSVSISFPYIVGTGMAPVVSGTIQTTVITNVPLVTIPSINLTPYATCASNNFQVFTTSTKSLSGTVTPAGGVMWVNGNIEMGNGIYTGCFIATGNIELKTTGQGTIVNNKVAGYPLLIAQNITVKQAKTWTFRGLVYCMPGNFSKQGNGDVFGTGSVIANGKVDKNGGWSGMIWEDSTPVPPGSGGGGGGSGGTTSNLVGMTAWQK